MNYTNIRFEQTFKPARSFRSGVSLHGHTLHSRESLGFIYRLAKQIAPLRWALDRGEARYRAIYGASLDLSRAWWTPPLAAHGAWALETNQIENRFGLDAMVSLTDHDDIEAPVNLQILEESRGTPISVEWTVPYGVTFLHIGVHNIAPEKARATMAGLAEFTAQTSTVPLDEIFASLAASRGTLIVLNHPYWDEAGIGSEAHRAAARKFTSALRPFIHAFELNGLRPWVENHAVFELAKHFEKPLISGGDRHAFEPNTLLNLTNSGSFAEFVEEIRGGFSDVLVTQQYMEPLTMRILQNLEDILADQEHHPLGWRRWSDRAFYRGEDGATRSLAQAWGGTEPMAVRVFTRGLQLLRHPQMKQAFRLAFAKREEVVL